MLYDKYAYGIICCTEPGLKEVLYVLYSVYICIYGKGVKERNVNSKCTHRQMNRPWLTKVRPGLSSERALHRDRTTNCRLKLLKGKQYLVKRPQNGLDTKTYWPSAVKWFWLWPYDKCFLVSLFLIVLKSRKKLKRSFCFKCVVLCIPPYVLKAARHLNWCLLAQEQSLISGPRRTHKNFRCLRNCLHIWKLCPLSDKNRSWFSDYMVHSLNCNSAWLHLLSHNCILWTTHVF
jgi:hypothetical protein